ncbi:hypothetical protein SLG_32810 [Sphingobium sp. SYK-6]|uniref:PEPxxWA-CTERM sorting domain-containing protein n=1 Tax=Sphingobium sp. (strain NBRC 103272 / SYK-6) TaxID=627192 RepID=UPI0002276F34|nr:PEPxxWA-CTERM sorting domain-containing protein [Sphingobium sp. SYK-6]BAK67956.1 hypothetical protein SLG_32810 [Sphingobium sp. SYK-6]
MKTTLKALAAATALTAAALVAAPASAGTLILDVTDVDSVDGLGSPDNVFGFFNIGAGSLVTSIAWDLVMYADSPSWLSEMSIYFGDSAGLSSVILTPAVGDTFPGTGAYAGSGYLPDLGLDFAVGADGLLYIEFFEAFDDFPNDWDGFYLSGTLTIDYDEVGGPVAPIPEPATWAMMIGGLGAAGAMLRRRKANVSVNFA